MASPHPLFDYIPSGMILIKKLNLYPICCNIKAICLSLYPYDAAYLTRLNATPVSPTMPLTNQQYDKEMMFPVFDGLIPEGWLLDIASSSWKIDPRDRMSLLIACCKDCIGNISVRPLAHE